MTATSLLEGLKAHTIVVADTSDVAQLASLGARDATTNPSLVLKAASDARYAELIRATLQATPQAAATEEAWQEARLEAVLVAFGCEILKHIPGRVSTETPARYSFDQQAIIDSGRRIMARYAEAGIGRERVLIKIAATWEGIKAARVMEAEGINCNLTLLFSLTQAAACAEAGVTLISPFVGRILDWYKAKRPEAITPDPGVASVKAIYAYYKAHRCRTEVMGASFRSSAQVLALAGCDLLTISPALLQELAASTGVVERVLGVAGAELSAPARVATDEANFRWALNADEMSSDKLAEGIRIFHADGEKLALLLAAA